MEARVLTKVQETQPIVHLVLDGLTSQHSKRAYRRALLDFLAWHTVQGRPPLSKALVQRYKTKLQADGLAPSTINQRLSAVRKLALEAADNGLTDPHLGNGICFGECGNANPGQRATAGGLHPRRETWPRLVDGPRRPSALQGAEGPVPATCFIHKALSEL